MPIEEIQKEFDIELTEDEAVELYDMHLDEAAKRIIEMQRWESNAQDKKEKAERFQPGGVSEETSGRR